VGGILCFAISAVDHYILVTMSTTAVNVTSQSIYLESVRCGQVTSGLELLNDTLKVASVVASEVALETRIDYEQAQIVDSGAVLTTYRLPFLIEVPRMMKSFKVANCVKDKGVVQSPLAPVTGDNGDVKMLPSVDQPKLENGVEKLTVTTDKGSVVDVATMAPNSATKKPEMATKAISK
jgi:hypothetical protein